jgi:hypothetical protein
MVSKQVDGDYALRQLVPIRVVACMEGCLKASIAELIDHGDPYRNNARKLFQQIKDLCGTGEKL